MSKGIGKKTFLIGKYGRKEEINDEPLLLADSTSYSTPLEIVRKGTVDQVINDLPKRTFVLEIRLCNSMNTSKATISQVKQKLLI